MECENRCHLCEELKNVPPVQCRSKKAVCEINQTLLSSIKKVVDQNEFWSAEKKAEVMHRFTEIYAQAVEENVTIGGKTWETCGDLDTTPDYCSVTAEKKDHLMQDVLPTLDQQLVDLGRQRSHAPYHAAKQLARQCKNECIHLDKLKAKELNTNVSHLTEGIEPLTEPSEMNVCLAGAAKTIKMGVKDLQQELLDAAQVEDCVDQLSMK